MFTFKYQDNFEPDKSALWAWLYIKKHDSSLNGIERPGLFNSGDLSIYALGFTFILLFEGAATFWAHSLGIRIEIIIASIILDIFLALFGHYGIGKSIYYKNMAVVAANPIDGKNVPADMEQKMAKRYQKKVSKFNRFTSVFGFLIIASGILKFLWFYLDYSTFNATSLLILFFYLAGAILHLLCTGFFLYGLFFRFKINNQYKNYINSNNDDLHTFNPEQPRITKITKDHQIEEVSVFRHSIKKNDLGEYVLITNGVLTDEQLSQLIGMQSEQSQKRLVALKGLEHQLNMLA